MRIGLTYDLRDDYRRLGYSEEETAEFDSVQTVEALETALAAAGCRTDRIGSSHQFSCRRRGFATFAGSTVRGCSGGGGNVRDGC